MLEGGAVSNSLLAEDVGEDADHDVVDVVSGVLDDGVDEEQLNSDILEAVGGEEESHTVPFDDITDLDHGLVLVALGEQLLGLLEEGDHLNLQAQVVLLNDGISTPLSSSSLASISGLTRSKVLATQSSCLATVLSLSRGLTAKRQTKRVAKMIIFIVN